MNDTTCRIWRKKPGNQSREKAYRPILYEEHYTLIDLDKYSLNYDVSLPCINTTQLTRHHLRHSRLLLFRFCGFVEM